MHQGQTYNYKQAASIFWVLFLSGFFAVSNCIQGDVHIHCLFSLDLCTESVNFIYYREILFHFGKINVVLNCMAQNIRLGLWYCQAKKILDFMKTKNLEYFLCHLTLDVELFISTLLWTVDCVLDSCFCTCDNLSKF